ncbi:peptidase inhibitor family I36 protein [Promicromonospora sp. NPDC057488]|uniref:peptidase inhibitor family I36 protein n=1 Tax=Promicromonospora sp. NPDC057488 TaxID=3346147 RepID=UPI00366C2E76
MRRILTTLVSAAFLVGLGSVVPAAAIPDAEEAAQADGFLYVYEDRDYEGEYCQFSEDHSDYRYPEWMLPASGECWDYFIDPDIQDAVSSVKNNGYPGSYGDVLLYKDANEGGTSICLPNGAYWNDLDFLKYPDGTGVNDTISSHEWANC